MTLNFRGEFENVAAVVTFATATDDDGELLHPVKQYDSFKLRTKSGDYYYCYSTQNNPTAAAHFKGYVPIRFITSPYLARLWVGEGAPDDENSRNAPQFPTLDITCFYLDVCTQILYSYSESDGEWHTKSQSGE